MVKHFSQNFSITDKETHCCLSVLQLNFFAFLQAVLSPPKQKTASEADIGYPVRFILYLIILNQNNN